MPETTYIRNLRTPLIQRAASKRDTGKDRISDKVVDTSPDRTEIGTQESPPRLMSYAQSLKLYSGRYNTSENPWLFIWRPVVLLASPTVMVRLLWGLEEFSPAKILKSAVGHNCLRYRDHM